MFVNCPFDASYRDQRDAIIFSCVHAGFFPWMAGSTGDVAVPRLERILEGLRACRYSIHDLTRYQGEGRANLSRFNMPLELGMAIAVRHATTDSAERHDWMVMVPDGNVFRRFISDLAGFDPNTHDGSRQKVAIASLRWLATRPTAGPIVDPDEVLAKLPKFSQGKKKLDKSWKDNPPWGQVIALAVEIVQG